MSQRVISDSVAAGEFTREGARGRVSVALFRRSCVIRLVCRSSPARCRCVTTPKQLCDMDTPQT